MSLLLTIDRNMLQSCSIKDIITILTYFATSYVLKSRIRSIRFVNLQIIVNRVL